MLDDLFTGVTSSICPSFILKTGLTSGHILISFARLDAAHVPESMDWCLTLELVCVSPSVCFYLKDPSCFPRLAPGAI